MNRDQERVRAKMSVAENKAKKEILAAIARGLKKISEDLKAVPTSPEREKELERYHYATQRRTDYQLADGVGNKHFKHGNTLAWDYVRTAFNGCPKSDFAEFLEGVAMIGGMESKARHATPTPPIEPLLHESLRRQHERHFDKFCDYIAWLCEGLLSRVLFNPRPDYRSFIKDDLCCLWEISVRFGPKRNDLPEASLKAIDTDFRDLIEITSAVLTDAQLRAGLLTLYFLYPEKPRSTQSGKTSPRRRRRPLFQALEDICVHWQKRDADSFTKPLDVLAWHYDQFKRLQGPERARAVFKAAGIDLDNWCERNNRDLADVVRHLDRAMTDQLRLREKRTRSK